MDDSSETSSNNDSYPRIDTHVEKTKVYTPIPTYLKLNLELYDLYYEFKPYLLTSEQLKMNGFPRESSVCITSDEDQGSIKRNCCRCNSSFYIQADGQYTADTSCRYHTRKPPPYRSNIPYSGDYPCCQGSYMSEGCASWQFHVSAENFLNGIDFVKPRNKRHLNEITACTIYAVDCEMVYTTGGIEVAKVGIVGVDGLTIFESFVLPQNTVLDYNTLYSGVSEKDLKSVTTTLLDVQAFLLKLLNKDSILVGHGLENDFKVLRLIHEKVVDTSIVFPKPNNPRHKRSLKVLAKEFLNKQIQHSSNGHDCIEDARTCMELMLLKISRDLKIRPPFTYNQTRNKIVPTVIVQQQQQTSPLPLEPIPIPMPIHRLPCTYDYSNYYCNSYGDNLYPGFLSPKKYYQKNCIY